MTSDTGAPAYRIDLGDAAWESPLPGMRARAVEREGRLYREVEFAADFVEPDWCRKAHEGIVLSGELVIDFDGREERFATGTALRIPPDHPHKARAATGVARVFLIDPA